MLITSLVREVDDVGPYCFLRYWIRCGPNGPVHRSAIYLPIPHGPKRVRRDQSIQSLRDTLYTPVPPQYPFSLLHQSMQTVLHFPHHGGSSGAFWPEGVNPLTVVVLSPKGWGVPPPWLWLGFPIRGGGTIPGNVVGVMRRLGFIPLVRWGGAFWDRGIPPSWR